MHYSVICTSFYIEFNYFNAIYHLSSYLLITIFRRLFIQAMEPQHQLTQPRETENNPSNQPLQSYVSPTTPPKNIIHEEDQPAFYENVIQQESKHLQSSLAANKYVLQEEFSSDEEEVLIFPDDDGLDSDMEGDEEVWEIEKDENQVRQFYPDQFMEQNSDLSESDSESDSFEGERWKRNMNEFDEDEDDNESLFRVPKKKKFASFYYEDHLSLNCYTEMTTKQKKKHFTEINKSYFESLDIQENYRKMAKESKMRFEKLNNLEPKQKKSVSFSNILKIKTFDKEKCPEEVKHTVEEEQKIIKNIWQFDEQ